MSRILDYLRLRRPVSIPRPVRYVFAFIVFLLLATFYLFSLASEDAPLPAASTVDDVYPPAVEQVPEDIVLKPIEDDVRLSAAVDPITGRANATIVILARNDELRGVEKSMRALEARFNHAHNYPYTFLNEVPFSDTFRARVQELTSAEVQFGLIPHEHWFQPEWVDEERVKEGKAALEKLRSPWPIPYAGSTPYRNMCRFNSGFFFRHELLKQYKWYWRVEPKVDFTCNVNFDPFVYMIENNKRYSFVISLEEVKPTVPSLWGAVKDFETAHPEVMAKDNALAFISDDGGRTFNYCHFWSNFEIGDLDFFRSPQYLAYFDFLDATGNFYYERWGDAPVHSIAAALFLPRAQLHFFDDIGYHHPPFQHCPQGGLHAQGDCACTQNANYDYTGASCLRKFESLFPQGQVG